MGLFSFLKGVGSKATSSKPVEPVKKNTEDNTSSSSTDLKHTVMLNYLTSLARTSGIEVLDLVIDLEDDKATIHGSVKSNTDREKLILMLGNVEGIATVEDRLIVEEPAPESVFYEVQKGDTLSKISKTHYGTPNKYMVIFEANKPMLSDPDKIYPGQVLRIPPLS